MVTFQPKYVSTNHLNKISPEMRKKHLKKKSGSKKTTPKLPTSKKKFFQPMFCSGGIFFFFNISFLKNLPFPKRVFSEASPVVVACFTFPLATSFSASVGCCKGCKATKSWSHEHKACARAMVDGGWWICIHTVDGIPSKETNSKSP